MIAPIRVRYPSHVRQAIVQLIGILRLARVSAAFGAVANAWFVILWSRSVEIERAPAPITDNPEWLLLAAGAVVAVGLYAFAAALNDLLDRTRDRALRRDRPLQLGQASAETAALAIGATALLAVLASTVFGTHAVVLTTLVALAVLAFNALGRHVPAIGMLLLSLIYATHMLIPNFGLRFLWPVWLVMTHAIAVAGVSHAVGRKRPVLSRRAVLFAVIGWVCASYFLLTAGHRRSVGPPGEATDPSFWPTWIDPVSAIAPAVLTVLYAVVAFRRVAATGPGRRSADKVTRYGALWLSLYACAWLYAAGAIREAFIMTGLAAAGMITMVVLRETYALIEHPAGYRR